VGCSDYLRLTRKILKVFAHSSLELRMEKGLWLLYKKQPRDPSIPRGGVFQYSERQQRLDSRSLVAKSDCCASLRRDLDSSHCGFQKLS
jgi:hypothetical protein